MAPREIDSMSRMRAPSGLGRGVFAQAAGVLSAVWMALQAVPAIAETRLAVLAGKGLGFNQSPAHELLLVALTKESDLALLEREQVEKIFEEQELTLALGAQEQAARREMGSLLKADLLVMIEAEKTQDASLLDVVVGDTETGLRLSKARVHWDQTDPRVTVEKLTENILEARRRKSRGVTRIAAVSPFLSEDLERTHDDLQRVYAEILEETLSGFEQLLLVELEEGQAISRELALSGGDAIKRVRQPFYFHGKYRNEGRGEERMTTIHLELKEGETTLAERSSGAIHPQTVASFLQEAGKEMLSTALGQAPSPFDPVLEAVQLAARGEEFQKIGVPEEALALFEASLLVMPDLKTNHRQAYSLCLQMAREHAEGGMRTRQKLDSGIRAFDYAFRSLDHLENLLQAIYPGELSKLLLDTQNEMDNAIGRLLSGYGGAPPQELQARHVEYFSRRWAICLTFMETLEAREILNKVILDKISISLSFPEFFGWTGPSMDQFGPPPPDASARIRLIRLLNNYPTAINNIHDLVKGIYLGDELSPEMKSFRDQIESMPGENVQLAIEIVKLLNTPNEDPSLIPRLEEFKKKFAAMPEPIVNLPSMIDHKLAAARSGQTQHPVERVSRPSSIPQPPEAPTSPLSPATEMAPKVAGAKKPASIFSFGADEGEVSFKPLMNLFPPPSFFERVDPRDLTLKHWVPLSEGLDALCQSRVLYYMRSKGELEGALRLDPKEGIIGQLAWDGRFLWAPVGYGQRRIYVLDPSTGKSDRIDVEDGLPEVTKRSMVLPIEPGKVAIAGYDERGWVGTISYAPSGRKEIAVIHEFRTVYGNENDVEVAFLPEEISFTSDDLGVAKKAFRVKRLIRKDPGESGWHSTNRALVVDLEERSVRLGEGDPQIRLVDPNAPSRGDMFRMSALTSFPSPRDYSVQATWKGLVYAFKLDAVHQIERRNNELHILRKVNGKVPTQPRGMYYDRKIHHSNHYGVVYQVDEQLYQVVFRD